MCYKCHQPSCYTPNNCIYMQQVYNCNSPCDPCSNNGPCPIKLDFQCSIYHKDNNTISQLTGLDLGNGATLQLIIETIDTYIRQLKVLDWSLTCLRGLGFTINTVQQFGQAVDTRLCELQTLINNIAATAIVPITPVNSNSIDINVSGTNDHTITANLKISATGGNRASVLADGLMVTPQTLSPNYTTKEITIIGGNTISLASMTCGVGGFLGNFTADPPAIDGQYWYRTDLAANLGLRIMLNSIVKTITIS